MREGRARISSLGSTDAYQAALAPRGLGRDPGMFTAGCRRSVGVAAFAAAGVAQSVRSVVAAPMTPDVLDVLEAAGDPLTAVTIAKRLGAPVTQVMDALATLRRSGCAFCRDNYWQPAPALRRERVSER